MNEPQLHWDDRWRRKSMGAQHLADPWLLRVLPFLKTGKTLDIACGNGRNAIFLAEQGFQVTGVDFSLEALAQLGKEASARRLVIETQMIDLEVDLRLPVGPYDLVIDFFYLHRPLLPQMCKSLKPGGLMVLRTFSRAGHFPGGPENPDFVLDPGELLEIFGHWEVLLHEEGIEPSLKGGSLAGIVARRPPDAILCSSWFDSLRLRCSGQE